MLFARFYRFGGTGAVNERDLGLGKVVLSRSFCKLLGKLMYSIKYPADIIFRIKDRGLPAQAGLVNDFLMPTGLSQPHLTPWDILARIAPKGQVVQTVRRLSVTILSGEKHCEIEQRQ